MHSLIYPGSHLGQSIVVEKDVVDPGFLTVADPSPIDHESYTAHLEEYLQSTARDGIQSLIDASPPSTPRRPPHPTPYTHLPPSPSPRQTPP
ncbi:hypothetical protein OG21DRAFT_1483938 [Imleria badia]|nr:hypothetical protein OG21DRAFT_1483938 [Imleria badia]